MGKSWQLPMKGEELQYGVAALPELYKVWAASGMVANIGTRILEVAYGRLVLEATMTAEAHGFPTADLKVDFLRPAKPGRLVARATVRHRTRRLAFCETTVEQADGQVVAEARAVIAYVKA